MACIRKRRGRYVLDFCDQTGNRRWETMPEGATKKAAEDTLRARQDQIEKGVYRTRETTPAFEEVARAWLEHKRPNLRETTWSVYEGHVRNHFKALEGLKINRITTATVEKFITDKQNEGMHLLTLRKVLVALNQVMAYAVRHRYLDHNPVRDAERPRGQGEVKQSKIRVLSPAEIKALVECVESPKYRTMFMVAIMSGVRQGELLGLKWSDVDWENRQIQIQRTFNNQRWFDTKSRTSNRRIDLGPATIAALKWWKSICPENTHGLIFPNGAGEPMNHNNLVTRHFFPALKAAGLPQIRFHDLRHTYASLLIEQGENVKYIQAQLGHSSPTVTLNVYAHLMKPTNQESACKLEKTIFAESGSKMVAGNKKGVTA